MDNSSSAKSGKKEWKFWSITIAILALVVFIIIGLASVGGGQSQTSPEEGDWTKGNAQAPAYLIEYSDFQCPACAAYYPLIKQLIAEFPDNLRVIYRHFPLTSIHKNAQLAAQAAEAAGLQNKFWEMHDLLFEKQLNWSNINNVSEKFNEYAGMIGLDVEKFKNDLSSPAVQDNVSRDVSTGTALNIGGTPTFFLNGKQIKNPQTYDALQQLIKQELPPK